MARVFRYIGEAGQCAYLPDQTSQLEYLYFEDMTVEDHHAWLNRGWRRAGLNMFRPQCPSCQACQSLRVPVDKFEPSRSQRRVQKLNQDLIQLEIGEPIVTVEKADLYFRHHAHHHETKEWPVTSEMESLERLAFLETQNPFPTQEWRYTLNEKLIAVCFVDVVHDGFSGIYSIHDPDYRQHSLGTWMILTMIERASQLGLPYVYLGYYVPGCRSMEYKGKFRPHQILGPDGSWHDG
jgi:leucyl-tRNA---protein transferase